MLMDRMARRCAARADMAFRGPLRAANATEDIDSTANKAMTNAQVFIVAFSHGCETRLME